MGDGIVSTLAAAAKAVHCFHAREWPALARIMTLSAACALVSGGLSAASTKIVALLAGPVAIGLLATLQQIRETALTGATLNGRTALVQGAAALRGRPRAEYVRTATLIFAGATALAAGLLMLAPLQVARWSGLPVAAAPMAARLSIAVAFSSVFVYLSALLNALGAARKLALLQLAGPGAMALLAWPVARREAFALMLGAAAAVTALAAALALLAERETLPGWYHRPGSRWSWTSARHFFSMSGVMFGTALAGSAVFLAVRANIVREQGLAGAGQFDAAWNISTNQVSLVLASLQTHYLPALAAEPNAEQRGVRIARVLALAAPASAVAIAAVAGFKPFWLSLFYSRQFHPAARYLRWTLAGDYLKVSSWILSVPMLASADMRVFLFADLAASAAFLAATVLLTRLRSPAEAAAIGFVLMHAVHLAIGAVYTRRRHGLRWRSAALPWSAGLALVAGVSVWNWSL